MISLQQYSSYAQIWPLTSAETALDPGHYHCLGVVTITSAGHLTLLRADLEISHSTDVTQQSVVTDDRYGPVFVALYPGLTPSTPLWSLTTDIGSHSRSPGFGITVTNPGTYSIFVKNNTNRFALSYGFDATWDVRV